jgi:hypothetical protein
MRAEMLFADSAPRGFQSLMISRGLMTLCDIVPSCITSSQVVSSLAKLKNFIANLTNIVRPLSRCVGVKSINENEISLDEEYNSITNLQQDSARELRTNDRVWIYDGYTTIQGNRGSKYQKTRNYQTLAPNDC